MGRFKVKDIRTEEFMGELCEIKFVEVYIMDQLIEWIEELVDVQYKVVWCSPHRIYMKSNIKERDYVFIDCKQKINPNDTRITNYFQPVILMF